MLERATILAEQNIITLDDLPAELVNSTDHPSAPQSDFPETRLESIERSHIQEVLQQCQGNKTLAAQMLGIHRRKLYRLIDRFGLTGK